MILMWLTSKAQTFIILVLLGLYSLNSFGSTLTVKNQDKETSYSKGQIEVLTEKLSFKQTSLSQKDLIQKEMTSALIEISEDLKKKDKKLDLISLLSRAGNSPLPFNSSYLNYSGNNYQYYSKFFNENNSSNFKLQFFKYYLKNYDEFKIDQSLSLNLIEFNKRTFQKLKKLIKRDLYKTINHGVNTLLDRNSERGLRPVIISKDVFDKTFYLNSKREVPRLGKFLNSYLFEMQRNILGPEVFNKDPNYQDLRGILGDFDNDQFFTLVFNKSMNPSPIKFDALFDSLKEKIEREIPNLKEAILRPRIINEELNIIISDYIQSPNSKIKSSQFIGLIICGLNENTKIQLFNDNRELINYCHFNSLHTAFLMRDSKTLINLKAKKSKIRYSNISSLLQNHVDKNIHQSRVLSSLNPES